MVRAWGRDCFSIRPDGNLQVHLRGTRLDLHRLVCDLIERGISTPLLLRFADILEDRIRRLHSAFQTAMKDYGYEGSYSGVFPIKVNQQRQVVEEIVNFGRPFGLGLEAGSKPELLIALALHGSPESLIVCNGFKDVEYNEIALHATRLGKHCVVVLDRLEEVFLCLRLSKHLGIRPRLGVRVKLSNRGAGKWMDSTGDGSKFGLLAHEILQVIDALNEEGMLDCLELLHFHIGSQITDIRAIKNALREGTRIYSELVDMGAPMGWIDVGGGLGVDYDGSQTNYPSSMNYTLQEYANDVVSAVQDGCESKGLTHPCIVSESGRALVAHHSVLVFNVLGKEKSRVGGVEAPPEKAEPEIVHSLYEVWEGLTQDNLIECFHDAMELKEEAQTLFDLGYLNLVGRASCEELFWSICHRILEKAEDRLPEELEDLPSALCDTFFGNFSVFQSLPDHWAVQQLFPTMPIHRLNERPTCRGVLADLTCDSDGKMNRFIDNGGKASFLSLHEPGDKPYYVGVFLVGAYQEVLGDLHNLFGDTNVVHVRLDEDGQVDVAKVVEGDSVAELLQYVQYDPEELVARLRQVAERALREDRISKQDLQTLLGSFKQALRIRPYPEVRFSGD